MSPDRLTAFLLTYNHAKYIRKCFDSMLSQKTSFPFKIVVLDDCSTDGTSDIVREYVRKYPDKVTAVINERNLGLIENVYRAFCKIDTKYFTLLEGDDYWCDDTKLQRQVELLDAHPECDMCGHDSLVDHFEREGMQRMHQDKTAADGAVVLYEGRKVPMTHPSSRMYRKVYDFSKVSPKRAVVEDRGIFYFYYQQNRKFLFINQPMSVYNYTGHGVYSGASKIKKKLIGLLSVAALNEALDYKFDDYNAEIFRRILKSRHRPLFSLLRLFDKKRAYSWFIKKYTQ